jgi:hypothetical protein
MQMVFGGFFKKKIGSGWVVNNIFLNYIAPSYLLRLRNDGVFLFQI